jgi:hypothetical protein
LGKITFLAGENWTVYELVEFLHQLNILYNRLFVLVTIAPLGDAKKLAAVLDASLRHVPDHDKLKIAMAEIHSPAKITLEGLDGVLKQMREVLKDVTYRNKIERREMESDLRHKEKMNSFEEEMAATQVLSARIQMMKEAGFSEEEIRSSLLSRVCGPAEKIVTIAKSKSVALLPVERSKKK